MAAAVKLTPRQKKGIVMYAQRHGAKRAAKHFKVTDKVVYYYLAKARKEAAAENEPVDAAPPITVTDSERVGRAMAQEWEGMKHGVSALGPPRVSAVASKHEAVLDSITLLRRAIKLWPPGQEISLSLAYTRLALGRLTGEEP